MHWCIVCDGYEMQGRRVVIAGNDDHAAEMALQMIHFTPEVGIVTNSEALAIPDELMRDLDEMEGIVDALADRFVQPGYEVMVSRFDVALDFQCAHWRWPDIDDIACRARKLDVYYEGKTITSMTFGKGRGPLQVVIYDKSRQLGLGHSEWIKGVWTTQESYDEWLPVVRTEMRFGRAILRDFGVGNIASLRSRETDLIHYAVGSEKPWFRVASADTRGWRQDRRGAASWWRVVSQNLLEGSPLTGRIRRRDASSTPDLRRSRSTMITNAVQTAAWEKVSGEHAADSPGQYLGPLVRKELPEWLKAKGFTTWDRAVDFEAKKIVASGRGPGVRAPAG
jgi:hypothetical protein